MKSSFLFLFFLLNYSSFAQNGQKGHLDISIKTKVVEELQNLTGIKIDSFQTIVINFYDQPKRKPNGSCIDYYTKDYTYLQFFTKNPNNVQFFITQKEYVYNKKNVVEDENNVLRNLLFLDAKTCGNYIIIKPNGDFLKKLGEYQQKEIPRLLLKM